MMHNYIHLSSVAFQHANRKGQRFHSEPMVAFQPERQSSGKEAPVAGRLSWWNFLLILLLK